METPLQARKRSQPLTHALDALRELIEKRLNGNDFSPLPSIRTLAQHFGVAPHTVKLALHQLAEQQLIQIINRGGAVINRTTTIQQLPPPATNSPPPRPRLHSIQQRIIDDIRNGSFVGTKLLPSVKELCQRYSCSHCTVRSALDSLAKDNLLQRRHRRYTLSAPTITPNSTATIGVIRLHSHIGTSFNSFSRLSPMWHTLEKACQQRNIRPVLHALSQGGRTLEQRCATLQQFIISPAMQNALGYIVLIPYIEPESTEAILRILTTALRPIALLETSGGETPLRHLALARRPNQLAWFTIGYDEEPGFQMGRYLAQQGHRTIAWFSTAPSPWNINRLRGLEKGLNQPNRDAHIHRFVLSHSHQRPAPYPPTHRAPLHLPVFAPLIKEVDNVRKSLKLDKIDHVAFTQQCLNGGALEHFLLLSEMKHLFEQAMHDPHITAWVCANDSIALSALELWRYSEAQNRRKIALTGFDNCFHAALADLTSYDFGEDRLSEAMLTHLLDNTKSARTTQRDCRIAIPGQIIIRSSSTNP